MAEIVGKHRGEADGEGDEWAVSRSPAVRALLDHVAEELAAEFVRLMKASVVEDTDLGPEEERR